MRILLSAVLLAASAAVAQEGTSVRLQGTFGHGEYPLSLADRPLVLPNRMIEATPQFEYVRLSPNLNSSDIGIRVGLGLADRFQLDAITAFGVDPNTEWSKGLTGELRVLAFDSRDLDVALLVSLPFDFHDGHDLVNSGTIGGNTRYRVLPMFYLYGLRDLAVFHTATEFSLGLNGTVGVGIEPIQHLSLELETTVVHFAVTGAIEKTRWFGADYVPVAGLVNLAINRNLDVIAKIGFTDLKNGADAMTFVGGINARL